MVYSILYGWVSLHPAIRSWHRFQEQPDEDNDYKSQYSTGLFRHTTLALMDYWSAMYRWRRLRLGSWGGGIYSG
jgi:hypothetical protein